MKKIKISDFFSRQFEDESNKILMSSPSFFSSELMIDYIRQILGYGLNEFIKFAQNLHLPEITSKDITQLSSIDDCTINMCKMLIECNNTGLTFQDIAANLHDSDLYKFNETALNKYGENQVKTACQLGLTTLQGNKWYLTAIGFIYPQLSKEEQNKLLSVILLRDPFYNRVLCSLITAETSIRDYMTLLSESTIKRRIPSCIKLIEYFVRQCDVEGVKTYRLITT